MDSRYMQGILKELARISSAVILPHYNNPGLRVEMKADQTPVTIADRNAEDVMRAFLEKECPEHGIIGEEFPSLRENAEYTWVLDPIDGTKTFTAGCPLFGTLIGLRREGKAIWSAINLPALNLLYIGNNEQTWCNDRLTRIRVQPDLKKCVLLTTDLRSPTRIHPGPGWDNLLNATGMLRTWGDCYGYTLVANGGADIMCDPILNLWDVVALLPVLRGAGAAVADWHGGSADNATSLVTAHPDQLPTILQLLNSNPAEDVQK